MLLASERVRGEGQRTRILEATVRLVCERGYANTSVSAIVAEARVSPRAFYELFASREECFLAVLDEGREQASRVIAQAFEAERCWLGAMRRALGGLLMLFSVEPLAARVWLVESLAAGTWALERRERNIQAVTSLVLEHWPPPPGTTVHPLLADGVMASLHGLLQAHMLSKPEQPPISLLGECMGLVTAPYLDSDAVAREIERGEQIARRLQAEQLRERAEHDGGDDVVPVVLRDPRAHRARRCLMYLGECPGASNRQVARGVGIGRDAHISTLLARLHEQGLLVKRASRPGGANAWWLSAQGVQVMKVLRHTHASELGRTVTPV